MTPTGASPQRRRRRGGLRPLAGYRVIDITYGWAGPICGALLADMGAEVIKIESNARLDTCRFLPPFNGPGPNRGGQFNTYNRGKKSCTINLKAPPGIALARRLIASADVVVENFAPRVMPGLGLGYDVLRTLNPDLVMASLSGFGATGPYRDYVAFGLPLQAFLGLVHLTGYAGGPPVNVGTPIPDIVGGTTGALMIVAALRHRRRTGEGQFIDVSQCEAMGAFFAGPYLDYALNGREGQRRGNRDDAMAPHGVYRCADPEGWCAVAVAGDQEFAALCRVIGRPELVDDARFADQPSRWRHQDELEPIIEAWTRQRSKREVFLALQAAGVAAGPVHHIPDLLADPHLKQRGTFIQDSHPEIGPNPMLGPFWRLQSTPGRVERPAPLLGEHNGYVFQELLGLAPEEQQRLEASQVLW
ncbi:MAG: CoA transferase [Chloroflexi bacterium]|nr:CoA transferase [Chloroflexota bacterium]